MVHHPGTREVQPLTHNGDDRVPGGEREDVGAGDDAGAGLLDEGLDAVDEVEAAQRQVRRRVLLGHAAGGGVEQDGGVAALARQWNTRMHTHTVSARTGSLALARRALDAHARSHVP